VVKYKGFMIFLKVVLTLKLVNHDFKMKKVATYHVVMPAAVEVTHYAHWD
jgi:hypothetical protein